MGSERENSPFLSSFPWLLPISSLLPLLSLFFFSAGCFSVLHPLRFLLSFGALEKVILNKVLLVGTKTSTYIGQPVVPNAAVHAVVEEQGLNKKVTMFKYKKKKGYRRNIGPR
ncbi:hypothetical protein LOK49_LG05G02051 [Camellia lanceoleosa]|uniref:Uncharacterized protein n=1 Tax=Camellia lanceoleosa TaxID=1840588 RepID=A0ACC0HLR0_9ERIC|nr:hypothetical protein LOK49_LG05G02051 [Camellia lanceoleosa]